MKSKGWLSLVRCHSGLRCYARRLTCLPSGRRRLHRSSSPTIPSPKSEGIRASSVANRPCDNPFFYCHTDSEFLRNSIQFTVSLRTSLLRPSPNLPTIRQAATTSLKVTNNTFPQKSEGVICNEVSSSPSSVANRPCDSFPERLPWRLLRHCVPRNDGVVEIASLLLNLTALVIASRRRSNLRGLGSYPRECFVTAFLAMTAVLCSPLAMTEW